MEIIEELIIAGRERRHMNGNCLARWYDSFPVKFETLEFDCSVALIRDLYFEGFVGRNGELGWRETAMLKT